MIGEITPLVKVAGRRTWIAAVSAHIIGAAGSGALLGAMLGGLGTAVRGSFVPGVMVASALLASSLRDAGLTPVRLPSVDRQTPRWLASHFTPVWTALLWGADLGQGWTTRVLFAGYYGLVLWAILAGDVASAAVVLAAYGLGRALPVLVAGTFGADIPYSQLRSWLIFRQPLLQQLSAVALAMAGTFLLTAHYLISAG